MDVQNAIVIFGKVLPVILDVAGMIPGVNIPVNAVKLVEDGIALEEAAYTVIQSPAGAPIRKAINNLAKSLGMSAKIKPNGTIELETRDAVQADLDSGKF